MFSMLRAIPIAFKMIFGDPVNLLLAIIPTLIALALYIFTVFSVFRNSDSFISIFKGYIYTAEQADVLAKILTAVLVIFIFFLMSWTFIIIVGIIAAPFNSMMSSRIEKKLLQKTDQGNGKETAKQISQNLIHTFKNELKKIIFIAFIGALAFLLNLFPLLYPVGIFLVAVLLAVQFIDYSWSRHEMHFSQCLKDATVNIIPYSVSGFFFLLLVTVPIINAFIPALATSYYTVLWLSRNNKIQL